MLTEVKGLLIRQERYVHPSIQFNLFKLGHSVHWCGSGIKTFSFSSSFFCKVRIPCHRITSQRAFCEILKRYCIKERYQLNFCMYIFCLFRSGILQGRSAFEVLHMPTTVMPMVSLNTHIHISLLLHKVFVFAKENLICGWSCTCPTAIVIGGGASRVWVLCINNFFVFQFYMKYKIWPQSFCQSQILLSNLAATLNHKKTPVKRMGHILTLVCSQICFWTYFVIPLAKWFCEEMVEKQNRGSFHILLQSKTKKKEININSALIQALTFYREI